MHYNNILSVNHVQKRTRVGNTVVRFLRILKYPLAKYQYLFLPFSFRSSLQSQAVTTTQLWAMWVEWAPWDPVGSLGASQHTVRIHTGIANTFLLPL